MRRSGKKRVDVVIGQAPKLHEQGPCEFGEAEALNGDILQGKLGQTLLLDRSGRSAFDKVRQLGYKSPDSIDDGFHVVHCKTWSSRRDKRDNGMNNTFHIGNVLKFNHCGKGLPCAVVLTFTQSSQKESLD